MLSPPGRPVGVLLPVDVSRACGDVLFSARCRQRLCKPLEPLLDLDVGVRAQGGLLYVPLLLRPVIRGGLWGVKRREEGEPAEGVQESVSQRV